MNIFVKMLSLILSGIMALVSMVDLSFFNDLWAKVQEQLGKVAYEVPDRFSVVLFGLSAEYQSDTNRTDCIMIATIDTENKQLKLTSILRDTKASIPGYRAQKINAANRLGGPRLALETINQNFDLDIWEYITVDFDQFINIINRIGGTYIYLTAEEAEHLMSKHSGYSLHEGNNYLDGFMTLQYSRIRKIGSDVARVKRQKNVLNYLVSYASTLSTWDYLSLVTSFLGMVESTSLDTDEVTMLASIPIWEYEVIENYVPDSQYETDVWSGTDDYDEWVWVYNTHAAGSRIQNIINSRQ